MNRTKIIFFTAGIIFLIIILVFPTVKLIKSTISNGPKIALQCNFEGPYSLYNLNGSILGSIDKKSLPSYGYGFSNYIDVEYIEDPYSDPYKWSLISGSRYLLDPARSLFEVRPVYRTDIHPTGDFLAKLNASGELEKISLPEITKGDQYYYYSIQSWTKDGDVLITQTIPNGPSRGLWKYDWESGSIKEISPENVLIDYNVRLSPDGRFLMAPIDQLDNEMIGPKKIIVLDMKNYKEKLSLSCDGGWISGSDWYVIDPVWVKQAQELEQTFKSQGNQK